MRGVPLGRRSKENLSGKYPLSQVFKTAHRQFDSVGVFLVAFVLFGEDLFQPLHLLFCNPPIGLFAVANP